VSLANGSVLQCVILAFVMGQVLKRRALAGTLAFALGCGTMSGQVSAPTSIPTVGTEAAISHTFEFAGNSRKYYCFIPDVGGPMPLVVLLHGSGRNGQVMIDAWKDLALREHFIVAAPDAYNSSGWAFKTDSPAFFHAVVEQVKTIHAVDEARIYLFGHSAGAVHALVLAIVDSEYYAATAVHAGALPPGYEKLLFSQADRRMPIAIWVGSKDPLFSVEAVTATKQQFEANGFHVKTFIIPDHDHNYYLISNEINQQAWDFLKATSMERPHITGHQ
jgi:poly(3-hydroxybutyrate) depolymerase